MKRLWMWMMVGLLSAVCAWAQTPEDELAPTPAMGWNSWDSYGTTVNEEQVRQNADWMKAHLASSGWRYIVVDMEWFVTNPTAEGNAADSVYAMDANGRYVPAPGRFPTSVDGKGFAPLAAYVHSLGLKFGIHILQGIPREAVARNLPIEGSKLHALDAADTSGTCSWNPDYFDVKPTPEGQAYYDSIARMYASWGVDLVKVDCIAMPRFKADEIVMLRKALDATGRPIALSLSPGEPPIDHQKEMQKNAQQWRISNDIWDMWWSDKDYPQGLGQQFARVAYWNRTRLPGHWPDADMLPLGYLGPNPGWGKARESRLTHAEQRTMFTLWSIFRSPLMMGGDLPHTDAWTESLLTNREVLEVDQHSRENRMALERLDSTVWTAKPADGKGTYVAVFNRTEKAMDFRAEWSELGMTAPGRGMRDLWEHREGKTGPRLEVALEPHGVALLLVQ